MPSSPRQFMPVTKGSRKVEALELKSNSIKNPTKKCQVCLLDYRKQTKQPYFWTFCCVLKALVGLVQKSGMSFFKFM